MQDIKVHDDDKNKLPFFLVWKCVGRRAGQPQEDEETERETIENETIGLQQSVEARVRKQHE